MGAIEVWGTQSSDTCKEVARTVVESVGPLRVGFSVMTRYITGNDKGKWWFVIKAPEDILVDLEKNWNHDEWVLQRIWEKSQYFLEWGPVSRRCR